MTIVGVMQLDERGIVEAQRVFGRFLLVLFVRRRARQREDELRQVVDLRTSLSLSDASP